MQHDPIVDLDDIKIKKRKKKYRRIGWETRRVSTGWVVSNRNFGHSRAGCRRTPQHQVTTSDLALSNDDECDNQVQKNCSREAETQIPWEVVPLNVCPAVLVNAIKGLFVDFFSRITRTSWRTGVDVGTARQVARGGTPGITAIIIFIRTIWWVVSLPRLYIFTEFTLLSSFREFLHCLGRIWHYRSATITRGKEWMEMRS